MPGEREWKEGSAGGTEGGNQKNQQRTDLTLALHCLRPGNRNLVNSFLLVLGWLACGRIGDMVQRVGRTRQGMRVRR